MSNLSIVVCQIRTNCLGKYKLSRERLTVCLKSGLTVNGLPVESVESVGPPETDKNKIRHFSIFNPAISGAQPAQLAKPVVMTSFF